VRDRDSPRVRTAGEGSGSDLGAGKPKETMWSMEAIFLCRFLCVFCAGPIPLLCVSVGGTRFLCFAPVLLRAPNKRPHLPAGTKQGRNTSVGGLRTSWAVPPFIVSLYMAGPGNNLVQVYRT
jgi:hypothetical protein